MTGHGKSSVAAIAALIVVGVILVAACRPEIDLEAERSALLHADESWAAAAEAGDPERVFPFWTEDAVIYPPVGPPVVGIEAIRPLVLDWRSRPGYSLSWRPAGAEVSGAADLGYSFGTWRRTLDGPDGNPVVTTGSYVSIWRKQPDGSWKCAIEISNLGQLPMR